MQESDLKIHVIHYNDNTDASQHGHHAHCYNDNEGMMTAMVMLTMILPTVMANERTMPMLLMMRCLVRRWYT